MGGQDGFSRDLLTYDDESISLLGGLRFKTSKKSSLGLSLAWTDSSAGLQAFDLPADDYVAITPPTQYDFSRSHTYSDLDINRIDGDILFKYSFTDDVWLRADYRIIDYSDDAPYMADTSGTVQWATIALGWRF